MRETRGWPRNNSIIFHYVPITYRTKCSRLPADEAPRDVYVSTEQVRLTGRTGTRGHSRSPQWADPRGQIHFCPTSLARSRDATRDTYIYRRFKCAARTAKCNAIKSARSDLSAGHSRSSSPLSPRAVVSPLRRRISRRDDDADDFTWRLTYVRD